MYIADIFGKGIGSTCEEGLIDSNNKDDWMISIVFFSERCKAVWVSREELYHCAGVMHHMLKGLQILVGLGNPPAIFTTNLNELNSNESINVVVKQKINFKQTKWPEFNHKLKELVNRQREECIRALSGRGKYKLCTSYDHLQSQVNGLKYDH